MSPDDELLDKNFGKALDFVGPRVDKWIKELNKAFDALRIAPPQKELMQGLTVEAMLYNTMMPNDEIIAVLAGIIQNISTGHGYGDSLNWNKRAEIFDRYSKK